MPDEKETRQKIQFKKHLIDVGIKATLGHTISVQLDNLEKKRLPCIKYLEKLAIDVYNG